MLDKLRLLLIDADRSKLGKDSKFDLDIFQSKDNLCWNYRPVAQPVHGLPRN